MIRHRLPVALNRLHVVVIELVIPASTIAVLLSACHKSEPRAEQEAIRVHCASPTVGAVDETLRLRGRIATPPGGDLPIASQVVGRLVDVSVREGDRVAKGDLIATVDGAATRDALRQAEANVTQAQAMQTNAKTTLDRTRQLVQRGIAAKQELEDAVAKEEASRANQSAAVAAADLARRTLGRVQIRSSFEGVVTRVWRGPGALVDGTASTPVVQLAATGAIEFVVDATDSELERVREGFPVTGTLSAGDAPLKGVVRAKSTALDPVTGLGVIRVTLDAPALSPPLGAFGHAVVSIAHRDGVLLIPTNAIRGAVSDGAEVVVCKDGKAFVTPVQIGWRDDKEAEVTGGITVSDRIALQHVLGLETDTPITDVQ